MGRSRWAALVAASCCLCGLLRAETGAAFSGTVSDLTGEPVTGATVTLLSIERGVQHKTTITGTFRFEQLTPGIYQFMVDSPGFQQEKSSIELRPGEQLVRDVSLRVGSVPDMRHCGSYVDVDYSRRDHVLSGIVKDYDIRQRVGGVKLALVPRGEEKPAARFRTDRRGHFKLVDPPSGWVEIKVDHVGFWKAKVKDLLIPRETGVFITVSITPQIVLCQ